MWPKKEEDRVGGAELGLTHSDVFELRPSQELSKYGRVEDQWDGQERDLVHVEDVDVKGGRRQRSQSRARWGSHICRCYWTGCRGGGRDAQWQR